MASFFPIIISIVLAILYVAIASSGIRIYNACSEIKDSKKWQNMHALLANTLIIAMVIPGVLLTQFLSSGNIAGAMVILYGLMGLVGSSVAYSIAKEAKCESKSNASEKNFLMLSVAGSLFVLLGGGAFMAMSRRDQ